MDLFIATIAAHHDAAGFGLLALAAFIEYIFPPFPGDAVVVFGAFLVTRRGWSLGAVFVAVLVGSAAGFMIDYALGRALAKSEDRWKGRLARARPHVDKLVARFERHGVVYLCINRFLPSVRAFFFLAAGMAKLSPWKVLACGLVSAAAWNAILFALGATVGKSWERLHAITTTYGLVIGALLAGIVVGIVVVTIVRRRRR